jgi:hypothetical protein
LALSGCAGEEETREPKKQPRKFQFEKPRERVYEISGLSEEQKAALVTRVEEKWRAMERRDFATVYEYTTPNYREIFSKPMFLNKFAPGFRWELTGIDILHYDADAAVASVGVRVMTGPSTKTALEPGGVAASTIQEKWLLIDGEWWNNAK